MLAANLQQLVNEFGQTATLVVPSISTYDPATGIASENSTDTHTVKAYFAEYLVSEIDNDQILMGDRKVLIGNRDTNGDFIPSPDQGHRLTGVGDPAEIVNVQRIFEGSTVVCYICQVRD